ncbi:MAG: MotE family protein [Leptospirillia bacterium]
MGRSTAIHGRLCFALLLALFALPLPAFAAAEGETEAEAKASPVAGGVSIESIVEEANRQREALYRERERNVADQEARLSKMRLELKALIEKNETLRREVEKRLAVLNTSNDESLRRLISVYEAMEPEEAAAILGSMRESVALQIFAGMKGKSAAGIMGFIPTEKAARLGERLAKPK